MHQEELDVLGVVDEEGLVAGGHHVAGLLVGSITDLGPVLSGQSSGFPGEKLHLKVGGKPYMRITPLKRRRTQLSIPLGLRHEAPTRIKRSDWWRKKRVVSVASNVSP